MSLIALGGMPLVTVGGCGIHGSMALLNVSNITLDAALEAAIFIGNIFTEDGGSHTINTTGSSSLGWRSSTVTFANAGTTVKVGLAAVDTAAGPPARAVNVADAVTFDVVSTLTGGGGGITGSAWQESVPTSGTKTIANGDLVAFVVQMTARGGVDSVQVVEYFVSGQNVVRPIATSFTGGGYNREDCTPCVVITFSDGVRGYIYGSFVASGNQSSFTWNNASSPVEYGNFFQMPVPVRVYGVSIGVGTDADFDITLYSNPLGTPSAQKTYSVDAHSSGSTPANQWSIYMFSSPYSTTANQSLVVGIKPTTTSTISVGYISMNIAAHQKAWTLGSNCYAVNRTSGAFAVQNSNKDRFGIGLLIGAFSDGVPPPLTLTPQILL